MDAITSVSKGVFVFKNGFKADSKGNHKSKKKNTYKSQLWYKSYNDLLQHGEQKIQALNKEMFSKVLRKVVEYIANCQNSSFEEIPSAVLLMGINMPDHMFQLEVLRQEVEENITPHVAVLDSTECNNLKALVENMVSQFVNAAYDEWDSGTDGKTIKKSVCTFSFLKAWYQHIYDNEVNGSNSLVIIIPEFENFREEVLQNFVLIASSYIKDLPFIIIFGLATSVAVMHKTLPFHVSSKLNMRVFTAHSSVEYLNNILEKVILTEDYYFHLGGKPFTLLIDKFLLYDLSIKGFLQHFKYIMLEHYSSGNESALCTSEEKFEEILASFDHEDFENIRKFMSFRKYVENTDFATRIKLIEDDQYFERQLKLHVANFRVYMKNFLVFLKCLLLLVSGLPKAPLGKHYRELYATAMTENIVYTKEYQNCMQLLKFLSRNELLTKIKSMLFVLLESEETDAIRNFVTLLSYINKNMEKVASNQKEPVIEKLPLSENLTRSDLQAEILKMYADAKQVNHDEKSREKILSQITSFLAEHLMVPTSKPFHEIFIFDHTRDVKKHILGQYRGAIHTALVNPYSYLKCSCCKLPTESLVPSSLPDICIVYKLHLECGKLINLYDLMQAFVIIVGPDRDAELDDYPVDPKLQARFTKAIAELEFLGFIKCSKRKTDHVERLTWGAC